jgi:hypothetical protein
MAQQILVKRSTVTAVPSALANGELAYSSVSNKLWIGRPGGNTGDVDAIGGKYYTDIVDAATNLNTASKIVLRDASGNFNAGIITASLVGNVTGDLTGNADTATVLATSQNISVSGDLTAPAIAFDGSGAVGLATTLATVNSNVGSFGSTTSIPVLTVNGKGLITAASSAAITTSWNLAGDSGTTNPVAGGETLTVAGGSGVTTSVANNTVTIDLAQNIGTTSDVTFNNVTVDGILTTDDVTAATLTTSGNVIISGNLTVNGTNSIVNSTTVELGDSIITLNSGETGAATSNAGFEIERGTDTNVSLLWNETQNYWQLTEDGSTFAKILTAANFATSYTGDIEGGTF